MQEKPVRVTKRQIGDTLYINFIRNVVECDLEREFHFALMEHGLCATVESNNP